MKIDSSYVEMASSWLQTKQHSVQESLRQWKGERPDFEGRESGRTTLGQRLAGDIAVLTAQAREIADNMHAQLTAPVSEVAAGVENVPPELQAKLELITRMMEAITGKKFKLKALDPKAFQQSDASKAHMNQIADSGSAGRNNAEAAPRANWGMEYERHERYEETEQMNFSARGVVLTQDGQQIDFALEMNASRQYIEENHIEVRAGNAIRKDPLVVNFGGSAASLTSDKIEFDLDSDGAAENISFVGPGSGFLAIDNNADGVINDGSELFGPRTDNGFEELAAHDLDGNQWIDENDAVYNDLRVWTKDADGNDQLFALADLDVGAIYLGNVDTPFSIKTAENIENGVITNTGIYLKDSGGTGTIQEVDLTL